MVATRRLTVEEFETMPRAGRWELVDGNLVERQLSEDVPASVGATIIGLLWAHVHAQRLGRLYNAKGGFVLFPDRATVLAPDVAFVRADRAPRGKARKSFPRLAPDLVVEVLSPADRAIEAVWKIQTYKEAGVPLIWLVDPDQTTVTVIKAGKPTRVLRADDVLDGGKILPGLRVPVAAIFAEDTTEAVPAAHLLSIEEFASTPREGPWELIDGELVEMGLSAGLSGWIAGQIFARLHEHVPSTLGWVFTSGAGFILFADRDTVRSPDAAFVRRDRLPDLPESFIPMAPDLAVEVLSPSDRMAEALGKISMYLEAGVRIVWLVDPPSRTVTVFRPDAPPRSLDEADVLDGSEVLPDLSIPIASIFG